MHEQLLPAWTIYTDPTWTVSRDIDSLAYLKNLSCCNLSAANTMVDTDLPLEPAKPGESYEDLRKKNREEYTKRQNSPYSRPYEAPVQQRALETPAQEQNLGIGNAKKNKYGDSWTD